MSDRARTLFGLAALGLWLLSLVLPAYVYEKAGAPGFIVLLLGWAAVMFESWLPPGSPLGWIDNLLTPGLAVVLATGNRVSPWAAGVCVALAAVGLGPHDIGIDVRQPATPGPGQAAWFGASLVIAVAAILDARALRRKASSLHPAPPLGDSDQSG